MRKVFKVVDDFKRIPLGRLPVFFTEHEAEKWIMENGDKLGNGLSLSLHISYVN
jgi:hypothetical protein